MPPLIAFGSQVDQENIVMDKHLPQKRKANGFFIEAGARDGLEHSNTIRLDSGVNSDSKMGLKKSTNKRRSKGLL